MKKTILIALPLIATLLSSCNKGNNSNRYTFKGVHEFNYTETDNYIVQNKTCDYTIVLPTKVDSYISLAREELVTIFKEGTGISLNYVIEDESTSTHTSEGKYISLGDTKMFASSGLNIDKNELGTQAAWIQTKDKTIYLNGGDTHGVVYAVYDLMEIFFNFDTFSYDCINVDKHEDLKFYNINVKDIPDIKIRSNSWGFIRENPNNIAYRLRTPSDFSSYILEAGDVEHGQVRGAIHNSLAIVPKTIWGNEHSKWFSDAGDQICYTAHGDENERNALLDQAAKIIEESLVALPPDKYPLKNTVTFTMMDNHDICKCEACTAKTNEYGGAYNGTVITFCNDLMARIKEWMNKEENAPYRRDDFTLLFFAYNEYVDAPAHLDGDKYVINHSDLKMRDDVGVYLAVSSGFQYQLNPYDDHNRVGVDNLQKWKAIAPSLYLWTYCANFGDYLFHVNTTNFYNPEAYQMFADAKTKLLYNQGGWNDYNLTAFQMLGIYLDAKLSWNSNLDMNALIDKWFKNMFKDAAEDIKKLYNLENLQSLMIMKNNGNIESTGIINITVKTKENFPLQLLYQAIDYIKDARAKIEVYKEINPTLYKTLKEHIDLEWVSPAYYLLDLYGKSYLPTDMYNEMAHYFNDEILPLKPFSVSERAGDLTSWILSLL